MSAVSCRFFLSPSDRITLQGLNVLLVLIPLSVRSTCTFIVLYMNLRLSTSGR